MMSFLAHLFESGRRIDNDLKFLFGILSFKCGNKSSMYMLPPNTFFSVLAGGTRAGLSRQRGRGGIVRREHVGLSTSAVLHHTRVHWGSVLTFNYVPATRGAAFVHESSMTCRDCVHAVRAVDKTLPLFITNINAYRPGRPQKVTR